MLSKRNGFVQSAGLVAIAVLVAGCQTGQKNMNVSFNDKFPEYGSDIEDTDSGRGLASVTPIKALLELLRNPEMFRGAAQSADVVRAEFKSFINTSSHADLVAVRKGGKALEIEDLDTLVKDMKAQGRIIKAFMDSRSGKKLAGSKLQTEALAIVEESKAGVSFAKTNAAADARFAARKGDKNRFQMTTDKGTSQLNIQNTKARSTTIDAEYKALEDQAEFQTADGRALIADSKNAVGDYHKKTLEYSRQRLSKAGADANQARGRSIVTKEMCENIDGPALKSHTEMVQSMSKTLDEADPKSGKRWGECLNIADVEAWMIAKYQSDVLFRTGLAAHIAVQEMGTCKYAKKDTAEAAGRKVAAAQNDVRAPDCK